MQEPSQATGTWRIGFDLAAFVLLATVAGMAAAVTLASIALVLTSTVSGVRAPAAGAPHVSPAAPAFAPSPPEAPGPAPTAQTELARVITPAH